jgi:hypothetical protein
MDRTIGDAALRVNEKGIKKTAHDFHSPLEFYFVFAHSPDPLLKIIQNKF